MRSLIIAAAILFAPLAQAEVSFTEYEAVTQAAAARANACKAQLMAGMSNGPKCERYFEYMDRFSSVADQFSARMDDEGIEAFGGAGRARIERHGRQEEQLTTNTYVILEMLR